MGNGHQVQIARKRHFTVGTFNSGRARCSAIGHKISIGSPRSALCSVRCAFLINRLLFLWLH